MRIRDLSVTYPGFSLGPFDIDLDDGVTCLVGANGAGKSTLLRVLAGVESSSWGVRIRGTGDLGSLERGYLPQDPQFPQRATCQQYVEHIAWIFGVPSAGRRAAARDALGAVNLADRADSRISTLSGGMRRRLGIAQVVVHSPALILLDEPTAGLDPVQSIAMRELVLSLAQRARVLVSTHSVEDVSVWGEHVLVLRSGALVFSGNGSSLARPPEGSTADPRALEHALARLISEPDGTAEDVA